MIPGYSTKPISLASADLVEVADSELNQSGALGYAGVDNGWTAVKGFPQPADTTRLVRRTLTGILEVAAQCRQTHFVVIPSYAFTGK